MTDALEALPAVAQAERPEAACKCWPECKYGRMWIACAPLDYCTGCAAQHTRQGLPHPTEQPAGEAVCDPVLDNTHEQMNPKQTGNLCSNCGHSLYYHSKELGCHVSRGSFNDGNRCHNTVPYHCKAFQPAREEGGEPTGS